MIRTLSLTCSRCGNTISAQDHLYYQDDFTVQSFQDIKLVCDDCIRAWKEKWTVYKNMDCTPLEDTESVITGEDIPAEAQHALYEYYVAFAQKREAEQIKDCFFTKREDGKMSADITTVGGEQYDKLIFYVEEGYLKTEQDVPDYVMEGLVTAYKSYLSQEQMLSTASQPAPRMPQRKPMPESQWNTGEGYGSGNTTGGFGRRNRNPFGGF